ncbi:MAG: glycoside hydrolase family 16 protein [Verrucomicrobiota bacterium]
MKKSKTNTTPVWSDDFDGPELDRSKWECEVNAFGGGNVELQLYTDNPKNVRVENGCLILEARREKCAIAGTIREYSSGRIRSKHRGDWTHGRFEVCAKLPAGKGLWPAIWMLPTDEHYGVWSASGEIDIMESVGNPQEVSCALHFGETWPRNVFTVKNPATVLAAPDSFSEDFHVFALDWRQDKMLWLVDDTLVWEQCASVWRRPGTVNAPFDRRFHLLLNLAVGGKLPGNPGPGTRFPARMKVDWVRVYA